MSNNTILVVDDELESVFSLSRLIQKLLLDVTILQAVDCESALSYATEQPVDLAFLDIEMPGQNGIALAAALLKLAKPPVIIFVTASNDYAVSAFELNAVDYVLKPFSPERVKEALSRAESRLVESKSRQHYARAVSDSITGSMAGASKLWAERGNGARLLINFSDIGWASARDKEVFVRLANEELRVRMSLSELERLLPSDTFVRVHRSHLINIQLAREIITWDSHSMTLVMGDVEKSEIPVSRSYVHQLKQIAGW